MPLDSRFYLLIYLISGLNFLFLHLFDVTLEVEQFDHVVLVVEYFFFLRNLTAQELDSTRLRCLRLEERIAKL